jgi:hypothetical protein
MLAIAGCASEGRDDWDRDCEDASQAIGMLVVAAVIAVPIVLAATGGHGGGHCDGGHWNDGHGLHDRGHWDGDDR